MVIHQRKSKCSATTACMASSHRFPRLHVNPLLFMNVSIMIVLVRLSSTIQHFQAWSNLTSCEASSLSLQADWGWIFSRTSKAHCHIPSRWYDCNTIHKLGDFFFTIAKPSSSFSLLSTTLLVPKRLENTLWASLEIPMQYREHEYWGRSHFLLRLLWDIPQRSL